MDIREEVEGGICRLELGGELTVYQATEIKTTLVAALQGHSVLEFRLGAVGEIDTAGLQLLILIKREAMAMKKTFRMVERSHAVTEIIGLFDMDEFFDDAIQTQQMNSACGGQL